MIQSTQELPLILPTNTSDITFLNDELRTRSATCSGWLNHTEGTSQYTILGNGNCCQPAVYEVTFNANGWTLADSYSQDVEYSERVWYYWTARQPEAAKQIRSIMLLGQAVSETTGLYSLLIGFFFLYSRISGFNALNVLLNSVLFK